MKEEVVQILKDRLRKELRDVIEYNNLYELLENPYEKNVISHICEDEYEHAALIQDIIDSHKIELADDYTEMWKKATDVWEN